MRMHPNGCQYEDYGCGCCVRCLEYYKINGGEDLALGPGEANGPPIPKVRGTEAYHKDAPPAGQWDYPREVPPEPEVVEKVKEKEERTCYLVSLIVTKPGGEKVKLSLDAWDGESVKVPEGEVRSWEEVKKEVERGFGKVDWDADEEYDYFDVLGDRLDDLWKVSDEALGSLETVVPV